MELNRFYQRKGYFLSSAGTLIRDEADGHEIETLLKEGKCLERCFIPSEMLPGYKGPKATEENSPGKTVLLTASTPAVDRDQEVLIAKGINLKQFLKNPVLVWNHDTSIPPVGVVKWARVEDEVLKAYAKFAERPADLPPEVEWLPSTLYSLVEQGILKGVSIGFIPLDKTPPNTKEIEARPELAAATKIIRKSLLLEISLVPIGCNQEALVESYGKGLIPDCAKLFGIDPEPEDLWVWEAKDLLPPPPVVLPPSRLELLRKIRGRQ